MSGIYGFAAQNGTCEPASLLGKMQKGLEPPVPVNRHQWTTEDGHAGLGAIHPARIGDPGHFAADPSYGVFCALDGIIYRAVDTSGEGLVEPDAAAFLLKRYLESGTERLSEVSGSFNVAWWDAKARRLTVANDKIGQRPLFYGFRNGALVFASLLARVIAAGLMSTEIDVEALADLISFEHIVGERTLFKDIRVLPPASILTYENGQVKIEKYWHIGQIEPHGHYDNERLDELEELFKRAVRRAFRPDLDVTIDLTGGLDSRGILAAAVNMQLPFSTHTGGQPDSTDVVFAKQMAALVGAKHIFEPVGPERAAEWLIPMVRYQGGMISTLHSHPCQHFDIPLPFDACVQGQGRNYLRPIWVTVADLDLDTPAAVHSLLMRKVSSALAKRTNLAQLWRPEYQRVGLEAPEAHIWHLLDQYNTRDRPVAAVNCFALHERCRTYLNKAILIVRAAREVYQPFFDHELLVALAGIPVSERVSNSIQIDLIKRLFPELLDVPYTNTLMPASASPTRVLMTHKYWALRRRASRWLGLPCDPPAEVPNHYYTRWTRDEMRPTLVELLYNPSAAFRAYFSWEPVKHLLDQHFSGQRNWEHLVATLTVLEISHKLWIDP